MQISTTARHCEIDAQVREFAQQRLAKLERFARDIQEAHLVVTAEKFRHTAEITLPTAVHAIVSDWCAIHELSYQAAIHCDRAAARQALFLDPHVRDMYDIEPMLEDMLEAMKPWLGEKWFQKTVIS